VTEAAYCEALKGRNENTHGIRYYAPSGLRSYWEPSTQGLPRLRRAGALGWRIAPLWGSAATDRSVGWPARPTRGKSR